MEETHTELLDIDQCIEDAFQAFAPNTIKAYKSRIRGFVSWLRQENINILNVTGNDIAQYMESVLKESSYNTKTQAYSAIKKLMKHIKDLGFIDQNPTTDLANKELAGEKIVLNKKPMSPKDVVAFFAAIPPLSSSNIKGARDRAMFALMFYLIVKRSELANLSIEDCSDGQINLGTASGKKARILNIPTHLQQILDHHLEISGLKNETGPLFRPMCNNAGITEKPISTRGMAREFTRIAQKAGISPEFSLESLRLSGIAFLVAQKLTLTDITKISGFLSHHAAQRAIKNTAKTPFPLNFSISHDNSAAPKETKPQQNAANDDQKTPHDPDRPRASVKARNLLRPSQDPAP